MVVVMLVAAALRVVYRGSGGEGSAGSRLSSVLSVSLNVACSITKAMLQWTTLTQPTLKQWGTYQHTTMPPCVPLKEPSSRLCRVSCAADTQLCIAELYCMVVN